MRHPTTSKRSACYPAPFCPHQLQIAARRMWEVTARCPGQLRRLTILPCLAGPFCLALSAYSDTVDVVGQGGFRD
jgi:hypothetical protein